MSQPQEKGFALDQAWTHRFGEARTAIGSVPCNGADDPLIETTASDREGWMRLAEWVGYTHDDCIEKMVGEPERR